MFRAIFILFIWVLCACATVAEQGQSPLRLEVNVEGDRIEFLAKNSTSEPIRYYNSLTARYGLPRYCWVLAKDATGQILTVSDLSLEGYWTPGFAEADAIILPASLDVLSPGESIESDGNVRDCLLSFRSWSQLKVVRPVLGDVDLSKVVAIKVVWQMKLDELLRTTVTQETPWIPYTFEE